MLSKNFARGEFECHGINCCSHSAPIDMDLVRALQILRYKVNKPIHINSGFRCITYNREIESRDTSQHVLGRAADVRLPTGWTVDDFYTLADSLPAFRGIGRYDWGLHLDVRNAIRTRWDKR